MLQNCDARSDSDGNLELYRGMDRSEVCRKGERIVRRWIVRTGLVVAPERIRCAS